MTNRILFIAPFFEGRASAIESVWISARELARALDAQLGQVDVLTPKGLHGVDEIAGMLKPQSQRPSTQRTVVRVLPIWARMIIADLRAWERAQRMAAVARKIPPRNYSLVVQMHKRFHSCGLTIARRTRAPLVIRVDALEIQEEQAWGLPRGAWGRAVEKRGELRHLREADLVIPLSSEVAHQLKSGGIESDRVVVIPSGVDTGRFKPSRPDESLLKEHQLLERVVVGWTGGFRPHHALDQVAPLLEELSRLVPEAVLCMVGAGPGKDACIKAASGFANVRFPDPVPHEQVARWINTFDICIHPGARGPYHYSPLKVLEYMACGKPVVAADVGQVSDMLAGGGGMLVSPDDPTAMARAISQLALDPKRRSALGRKARDLVLARASWEARTASLIEALESRGLLRRKVLGSPVEPRSAAGDPGQRGDAR